ncbi:hypothetical protein AYK24_02390 [Thermoplasmatales archaeon SG8-52-4]|nr:MAG: hypothetical protein AYK24_02390 [Thermoplasmatales archaeon SG8-52-4]
MKNILKSIVIGITLLFIGLAFQPIVSTNELKKEQMEPNNYLFETIIEIINNPEVNELLNQIEDEWKNDNPYITWDFDSKVIFKNLFLKKPKILVSMLFAESSNTQDYLESSYMKGCEITKALGEKNVIDVIDSVEITNPDILDQLNNFIMNDAELNARISTLEDLNKDSESVPFRNYSTICKVLLILYYVYLIRCGIVSLISKFFEGLPLISVMFDTLWFKNWELAGVCMFVFQLIYDTIGCEKPSPDYSTGI